MAEELTSSKGVVEPGGGGVKEKKSKYRLGKITNKYLIIDLYTLAYQSREEALFRMFIHDRSTRSLLLKRYNTSSLQSLLPSEITKLEINFLTADFL